MAQVVPLSLAGRGQVVRLTSGNVRVSVHPGTTESEVDEFLAVLPGVVGDVRAELGAAVRRLTPRLGLLFDASAPIIAQRRRGDPRPWAPSAEVCCGSAVRGILCRAGWRPRC